MDKKLDEKFLDKEQFIRGYGERIKAAAKKIGGASELSRMIHVPRNTLQRYIKEDTEPSIGTMVNVSIVTEVDLYWLLTGEKGTQTPSASGFSENNKNTSDNFLYPKSFKERNTQPKEVQTHVSIPVMDITASAGHGAVPMSEEQTSVIQFDRSYLHNTWNLNANDLFTINTIGESMEPTIKAGEYLLVSKSEEHMKLADGIFVIRLDGNILVKRLQLLPGKKIFISSDNPAYTPYEISLDDGVDFHIVGKVVLVHGVRKI